MDVFSTELNDLLVDTFRSILKIEEQALNSFNDLNLSISELHLIESVGKQKNREKTISEIADALDITLPSVTVAINKLVQKGYVRKAKSGVDGRSVNVSLTKLGLRADAAHRYFHQTMVHSISRGLTEEEKTALIKGIRSLNGFFKGKIAEKNPQERILGARNF